MRFRWSLVSINLLLLVVHCLYLKIVGTIVVEAKVADESVRKALVSKLFGLIS
jgi:hypothetical protein